VLDAILVDDKPPPKQFKQRRWGVVKVGLIIFAVGYFGALLAVIVMAYGQQGIKEDVEPFHRTALVVMLAGAAVMMVGYQQK
jgi:hypothetical protein